MLISCWGYHPEQRPSVSKLIEILTGSECLMTPCLNTPKECVALELQESMDIVPLRQCGHKYRQGLRTPSDHIQNAHDSRIFSHSPTSMSGGVTEPFLFPPLGSGSALPGLGGHGVVVGVPGTMNNVGVGGGSLVIVERGSRLNSDNPQSEDGRTLETLSDSSSASDSEPDLTTACLSQSNKSRHTGGPHSHGESSQSRRTSLNSSSKSSSPDSPTQLRYVALPHDSDYSSGNSKELWMLNGSPAV